MPWNRLHTATASVVLLATLAVSTPLAGQKLIERSVTIRQGETLLVGAIDLTQFPLDDPARSFYLVKHQERYWPFEEELVPMQTVTGFGNNKWFFFVKVDSWDANAAKHTLTLSLKSPVGLMEDIFTLPLLTRQCRWRDKSGNLICRGGLTDFGTTLVTAERGEGGKDEELGDVYRFTFERDEDPEVRAAFERRFEIEVRPIDAEDPEKGTEFFVTRRGS